VRTEGLRYEVTVIDPHTFTRPWTAGLNLGPAWTSSSTPVTRELRHAEHAERRAGG
jgi:hypothetical protein